MFEDNAMAFSIVISNFSFSVAAIFNRHLNDHGSVISFHANELLCCSVKISSILIDALMRQSFHPANFLNIWLTLVKSKSYIWHHIV